MKTVLRVRLCAGLQIVTSRWLSVVESK